MKDGFLKVGAATPHIKVADTVYNYHNIIKMIKKAETEGVKLLAFPELCVTGYTCNDLFNQLTLIKATEQALVRIAQSVGDMLVFVGAPIRNNDKLYNCSVAMNKGKILGVIPKTNIPNYGEFYEKRHFAQAPEENTIITIMSNKYCFGTKLLFEIESVGAVVASEICEDLWIPNPPSIAHCMAGANIIVNPSASDEVVGKDSYRKNLVAGQSARLICGYIYSATGDGESTTDLTFGGQNIIAENGEVLNQAKLFENELTVTEIDVARLISERARMHIYDNSNCSGYQRIIADINECDTTLTRKISKMPFVPQDMQHRTQRAEYILSIQANGLKKRIEHSGVKTVVIGISGGLDSTLALLVAVRTMDMLKRPRTDIVAVTMPCFGTTKRTKSNACKLVETLGATMKQVNISKAVLQHFKDIGHDAQTLDVTYENSQARERTQVLMDIANKTGGLVVGTGDLSELALGWATYNGDHMSMYGVNAGIPKTLIRHLVKYEADKAENSQLKKALFDVLDTPVSPELLPPKDGEIAQKTEELVGPYELHDFFLYYAIRFGYEPKKVYRLAVYAFEQQYDNETIKKWLNTFYRRFFSQQFKRSCLPDGPKVGSVALSPRGDFRMPSDACSSLWLRQLETI